MEIPGYYRTAPAPSRRNVVAVITNIGNTAIIENFKSESNRNNLLFERVVVF